VFCLYCSCVLTLSSYWFTFCLLITKPNNSVICYYSEQTWPVSGFIDRENSQRSFEKGKFGRYDENRPSVKSRLYNKGRPWNRRGRCRDYDGKAKAKRNGRAVHIKFSNKIVRIMKSENFYSTTIMKLWKL
jgi:hypothetical protein